MEADSIEGDLSVAAFLSLPIGLAVIETPGAITWANPAYFETSGRDPRIVGQNFHLILEESGSWSTEIGAAVDAALQSGAPASFRSVRARYRHAPGGIFLDVDVRPLPPRTGAPIRPSECR